MERKSLTKDEKFLIEALKWANDFIAESSELEVELIDVEMDRYEVGQKAKLTEKCVNTIVAQLVRGNFARKRGEVEISLTQTGVNVAISLIS